MNGAAMNFIAANLYQKRLLNPGLNKIVFDQTIDGWNLNVSSKPSIIDIFISACGHNLKRNEFAINWFFIASLQSVPECTKTYIKI